MLTITPAIEEGRKQIQRDGFTVLRGFLTPAEAKEMLTRVDDYMTHTSPKIPSSDIFCETKGDFRTMFRLENLDKHDAWFHALKHNEKLRELAEAMVGEPAHVRQIEVFGKAPRVGNVTPPHQDGNYFNIEPNEAVTLWIPIDQVDEGNGTIRYVKGSHKKGMRPHALGNVFGFSLGVTDYGPEDTKLEVPIIAGPGDVIVHHSMTIHRADKNESDRLRRAIGLVYYANRAKQDEAAVKRHLEKVKEAWTKEKKI
jgi:phytanoyl-CoA hydroxylase